MNVTGLARGAARRAGNLGAFGGEDPDEFRPYRAIRAHYKNFRHLRLS
jgi:hypothetical protein